jgi:hypothetical protein
MFWPCCDSFVLPFLLQSFLESLLCTLVHGGIIHLQETDADLALVYGLSFTPRIFRDHVNPKLGDLLEKVFLTALR